MAHWASFDPPVIGIVMVSHGDMAESMIRSATMLTPDVSQVTAVSLWPEDNPDEFQTKLEQKVREVDSGDGVVILADMLGGTPCNRAIYCIGDKVRMLAGMSLPMLLSLLFSRDVESDISELVKTALDDAGTNLVYVNELMGKGDAE